MIRCRFFCHWVISALPLTMRLGHCWWICVEDLAVCESPFSPIYIASDRGY